MVNDTSENEDSAKGSVELDVSKVKKRLEKEHYGFENPTVSETPHGGDPMENCEVSTQEEFEKAKADAEKDLEGDKTQGFSKGKKEPKKPEDLSFT